MERENIVKTKSLETLVDFEKATLPSAVCVHCRQWAVLNLNFGPFFDFRSFYFVVPEHMSECCVCLCWHFRPSNFLPQSTARTYHQHKVFYIFLVFIWHIALSCCVRCCCCRFYIIVWVVSHFFISCFNIFFCIVGLIWACDIVVFFFIISRLIFHETNCFIVRVL